MATPTNPSLIARIAQAYMERERARLGIPEEEQKATESADVSMLRRAQAERIVQQMGMEPAEQESVLALRGAQTDQSRAYADKLRQPAPPEETPEARLQRIEAEATARARGARTGAPPLGGGSDNVIGATLRRWDPERRREVIVDKRTGAIVGEAAPPAALRGTAAEGERVLSMIGAPEVADSIWGLAAKINKGLGGISGRVTGLTRRGAAMLGSDPDVQVYQDQMAGMASRLAKAFGESGRLSDQDIMRTVNMFPRVGDSEEVTDRKMRRVFSLISSFGDDPTLNSGMVDAAERALNSLGAQDGMRSGAAPSGDDGSGGFRVVGVRPKQ